MPGELDTHGELRAALADDDLSLVFQPEYDLTVDDIVAVEALVRWAHPERGDVEPSEFVRLAEESGLIHELGSWVLETALTEFTVWGAQLPDLDVVLRLNVAIAQLTEAGFVDTLATALDRHVVGAEHVCIEITESSPRWDAARLADSIRGMRALGVQVAIDDLANGYSTLGMLRDHPIDVVKIDRALVTGVDTDPRASKILAALVRLAEDLGVTVVAEGIETPGERAEVVRLGCRRGQGYLMSLPVPGREVVRLLAEHGRRSQHV